MQLHKFVWLCSAHRSYMQHVATGYSTELKLLIQLTAIETN